MKIECEKCGAKYSIADDKVKGKTFKIRCKKCSNAIIVRDKPAEAVAEPEAAADDADDGWHVAIGDEQVGPVSVEEVQAKFAAGEIDGDSEIWREGFEDWMPLADVEDFADMLGGAAAAGGAATGAGHAQADEEDHDASEGEDSEEPDDGDAAAVDDVDDQAEGEEEEDDSEEPSSSESSAAGLGLDLGGSGASSSGLSFDSGSSTGFGGGSGFDDSLSGADEPEPESELESESELTGTRNENSVLFSLDNLSAMASSAPKADSGPSAAAVGSTVSSDPTKISSSAPMSEGSGLIDIRALGAVLGDSKSSSLSGSGDDFMGSESAGDDAGGGLMSFGGGGGFGGLAAMPVEDEQNPAAAAAAPAPAPASNRTPMILFVIAFLGLVLGAGYLFNKYQDEASRKQDELLAANKQAQEQSEARAAKDREELERKLEEALKAQAAGGAGADDANPAAAAGDAPVAGTETATKKSGSSSRKSGSRKSSSNTASDSPTATDSAPAPAPAPKKPTNSGDDVDCLLDPSLAKCSGGSKKTAKSTATTSTANLPAKLAAMDLRGGISSVKSAAKSCGPKHGVSGVKIPVKLSISGSSGKVLSAVASGDYAGKPVAKCIESALKKATFKKFSASQQGFRYNVSL